MGILKQNTENKPSQYPRLAHYGNPEFMEFKSLDRGKQMQIIDSLTNTELMNLFYQIHDNVCGKSHYDYVSPYADNLCKEG